MPAYHDYPPHKRKPGREARKRPLRTKVVTLRIFETVEEYELMKPYLGNKPFAIGKLR